MRAIALAAYLAALLPLLAARVLSPTLAAAGVAAALVLGVVAWRRRAGVGVAAAIVALAASAGTWAATARIRDLPEQWPRIADRQVERGAEELRERVDDAVARARTALNAAAAATAALGRDPWREAARPALFRVAGDAQRGRADAVFILGPAGELLAWAGRHQGALPDLSGLGAADIAFAEGPLFDYLYVLRDAGAGHRLVAALLLETDPALADRELPSIASAVRASTGARPRFGSGPGPAAARWRTGPAGAEVAHAVLEVTPPARWRDVEAWRTRVLAVALAALVLALALGMWLRAGRPERAPLRLAPALALGIALAVAPQPGGAPDSIFNPAMFFLDAGRGITLWGGLLFSVTAAVMSAPYAGIPAGRGRAPLAALGVGAVLAAGAWLITASTSDDLLRSGAPLWWGLQVVGTAGLTGIVAWLLPRPGGAAPAERGTAWMIGTAAGAAGALALGLVLLRTPWQGPAPLLAAAWALPALLVARAAPSHRPGGLRRWLAAGVLAGTALLPQLWLGAQAARLRGAQQELERLTSGSDDPFLTFAMSRFALEARDRLQRGEEGPALLYRAWVGSGLAAEGYPVRLALWTPDDAVAQRLDVTGSQADPEIDAGFVERAVDIARQAGAAFAPDPPSSLRYAVASPLGDGWVASALVLPRLSLAPEGLAAAALAANPPAPGAPALTLSESTSSHAAGEALAWAPSAAGVRGEGEVRLGPRLYHAHVEIDQDPPAVRAARGVLLLLVDLAALAALWGLAHALAGSGRPPLASWMPAPGSFRSRVTLALFLFFLAPTLAFGAVAYRAVVGAADRETEALVVRASAQAADVFAAAGGNLQAIASLVGLDVLFYQDGELLTSSRPELVDLGVHNAFLPPAAYMALRENEALAVDRGRRLLGRRAVAAFRRLPEAVLGVPAFPGGAAAVRRAELTDMLIFAVVIGAVLSLALSLVAGRALARPIGQLSRAAAAVGAGRLRVRLPADRRDEFGELFRSFNRMTRRLRRARARELRTARVLAWGEMARQVAHEIKNPLTPIRLSVQHVRRAYRDGREDFGEILEGNVERVLHEIDRLSGIASAFARYGTPASEQPALEAVDVAAVARDVRALYASGDSALEVRVHADGVSRPAAARDAELREVLINLLENAREALPADGAVDVSVGSGNGGVVLEVSDTGEGIPAELVPNVFDPHFSTRSSGTGLGLAIVKRLVEGWGGTVEVESRSGEGTTFRIRMRGFPAD